MPYLYAYMAYDDEYAEEDWGEPADADGDGFSLGADEDAETEDE